jgi:hypothetical protein
MESSGRFPLIDSRLAQGPLTLQRMNGQDESFVQIHRADGIGAISVFEMIDS